jgi:hypothetical protein
VTSLPCHQRDDREDPTVTKLLIIKIYKNRYDVVLAFIRWVQSKFRNKVSAYYNINSSKPSFNCGNLTPSITLDSNNIIKINIKNLGLNFWIGCA